MLRAMLESPSASRERACVERFVQRDKNHTMTQQFWTEFLELYKENSCLWDIHSPTYMRRDLRNASYKILLQKYREIESDASIDTVKKKIDIFRTGFRRELRKINELKDSGTEYKPTLWYFELLSFLNFQGDDHSKNKTKDSNESDDQCAPNSIEYIDIPDDYHSTPNPVVKYRVKKKKLERRSVRPKIAYKAPTNSSCNFDDEEDDCSIYCASLKLQMRELDTEQKYIAQKLISDVIFLARTSQLTLDSSVNKGETTKPEYLTFD